MKYLLPLLLLTMSLGAVEIDLSEVTLPDDVVKIQEAFDSDLNEARMAYLAEVEKAKERALSRIERAERSERDVLVKLKIKQVMEEVSAVGAVDVFGNPVISSQSIIGTWQIESGTWKFKEDGTLIGQRSNTTWTKNDTHIIINWPGNRTTISLPIVNDTFIATGSDGKENVAKRIE